MRRKTLIRRSGVEWTDYNCNHYIGCAHNCRYPCYARLISKKTQDKWVKVDVVENALQLAIKEIRRVPNDSRIMVSSMTDPYQPVEKTCLLTRMLLPILASNPTVRVILTTKSDLVMRDFDIIKGLPNVQLCMSITAPRDLPVWEPDAPGNTRRIECLRQAKLAGIYTIASIEPWIIGYTEPLRLVKWIYRYVDEVFIGAHNYRGNKEEKAAFYKKHLPLLIKEISKHNLRFVVKRELMELILTA